MGSRVSPTLASPCLFLAARFPGRTIGAIPGTRIVASGPHDRPCLANLACRRVAQLASSVSGCWPYRCAAANAEGTGPETSCGSRAHCDAVGVGTPVALTSVSNDARSVSCPSERVQESKRVLSESGGRRSTSFPSPRVQESTRQRASPSNRRCTLSCYWLGPLLLEQRAEAQCVRNPVASACQSLWHTHCS